MNPIEFAENLVHDLVNVEGGACLYTVRGKSLALLTLCFRPNCINDIHLQVRRDT